MLPLYQLQIDIVNACNLRCIHCRVPEETRVYKDMTTDVFLDIISQARELGAEDLLIGGGEPMLRRDWPDMARHARDVGYESVTLLTNGTLFRADTPDRIRGAGINEVQVSIDGPTAEVHDYFRGHAGAFETSTRAIRQLVEAGLSTSITMTVADYNYAHAADVVELGRQLGVGQVTLRRFIPQGYGFHFHDVKLPITAEQTLELLDLHARLVECYDGELIVSLALFPFTILQDPEILDELRDEIRQGACGGCSAGVAALYVDPSGTITPCPHVPVPLGNVRSDKLADIWSRHPVVHQLRNRDHLGGACGTCGHRNVCGGCRAYPFALTGDLMGLDPLCPENRGHQEERRGPLHVLPADSGRGQRSPLRVIS